MQSLASDSEVKLPWPDKWTVILSYLLGIVILVIINIVLLHAVNTYHLTFGDGALTTTVFEDRLNLIITKQGDPTVTLRLEPVTQASGSISMSGLFDDKHSKEIKSEGIKFNEKNPLRLGTLTPTNPKDINVSITVNDRGTYHGNLLIAANEGGVYTPVTFEVSPSFGNVAIWVINGIAVSVGVLNLVGYLLMRRETSRIAKKILEILKNRKKEQENIIWKNQRVTNRLLQAKSDTDLGAVIMNTKESTVKPYLARIISKLEQSRPLSAKRKYTEFQTYVKQLQLAPPNLTPSARDDTITPNAQDIAFDIKKYATTGIVEKNIVSGITGIAFGIIVGFIPLLEQDLVTNITAIGLSEILILFGLGVGIGALNEAIGKIWETAKTEDEGDEGADAGPK
jgi:hypothetical protein